MFDNGSKFKRDFTPLIKNSDIKPVLTLINNPQANTPFERVHQVLLNLLVTMNLDDKVFDYIYPWVEVLSSIVWAI